MKTKIFVENYGRDFRVTLAKDQNQVSHNMFANLSWVCKERHLHEEAGNFDMFMVERNKFKRIVNTFNNLHGEPIFEVVHMSRNDVLTPDYRPHVYRLRGMSFQRLQSLVGEAYEG